MERGFLVGTGVGAGLMYVFDPRQGRRRRALARDQVTHLLSRSDDAISATARDMANRARGVFAEARALFETDEPSDAVLTERVRSALGRYTSHPSAIEVSAHDRCVTLSGPVLASEVDAVLRGVRRIRGVRQVDSRLDVHRRPDDVPGLQGDVGRAGRRFALMQENWSPTARVVVGGAGLALAVRGLLGKSFSGTLLGLLGLGAAARAGVNVEMKRLLGVGGGRRAVDVQKSIRIAAPAEVLFEFWRRYENFPRFMSNVREVRDLGDGRSHWTVAGPAGLLVEWDAEITRLVPNEVIAWKTVPGATVEHAGIVRFEPNAQGTTTVHLRMSYNPPAGAIGHVVATLFGADPKREMDADLARMKTLIETGRPPRDAAKAGSESETYVH